MSGRSHLTRLSKISRFSSASVSGRSAFTMPGGVLMNRDRQYQRELQRQLQSLPKPRNLFSIDLNGLMLAAKDRIEQLEQESTADSSMQEASDGRDQIVDVQMVLDKEEKIKQQLKELEHQNQMNL